MLSVFALCVCVCVSLLTLKQWNNTNVIPLNATPPWYHGGLSNTTATDINIADVQACEKAETLATHSLMPSNDANARKVCNSFYGSSSVQYAKKRGFQSDGDNR